MENAGFRLKMKSMRWRRLDVPGADECTLCSLPDGWRLAGDASFALENEPAELRYTVLCGPDFHTRRATVRGTIAARRVEFVIERRADGWLLDGKRAPAVADCIEGVDSVSRPRICSRFVASLSLKISQPTLRRPGSTWRAALSSVCHRAIRIEVTGSTGTKRPVVIATRARLATAWFRRATAFQWSSGPRAECAKVWPPWLLVVVPFGSI